MLYNLRIDDCLKILTNDEVKDFVVLNLENLHSKLAEEQILRKVTESLYIFLRTFDQAEKYVEMAQSSSYDTSICHYNIRYIT